MFYSVQCITYLLYEIDFYVLYSSRWYCGWNFLISFSDYSFLVNGNMIDFYILILYSFALPNLFFIGSRRFCGFLGLFKNLFSFCPCVLKLYVLYLGMRALNIHCVSWFPVICKKTNRGIPFLSLEGLFYCLS